MDELAVERAAAALFEFTTQLIALRQQVPLLHRRKFYQADEIVWLRTDGFPMTPADFDNPHTRCLGLLMDGAKVNEHDQDGSPIGMQDDKPELLLWLLNAYWEELSFLLPQTVFASWELLVDTRQGLIKPGQLPIPGGSQYRIPARSSILLRGH